MAAISKAEYLKRYLSTTADEEKKKKRKKKPKPTQKFARSIIVDDDVAWNDLKPQNEESKTKEFEFENAGDEAPVVYDEDGVHAISLDVFKKREEDQKTKWAPLKTDIASQKPKNMRSNSPSSQQLRNRRHDSPDFSPTRVSRADTPDNSHLRKRNHGSPDLSPSREEVKLFRKGTNDSPSRGGRSKHLSSKRDVSPPQRVSKGSPSNARKSRHDSTDLTPPRRQHHDSSDTSPVRNTRHDSPDQSPSRRRKRHDSSDFSPPRGTKDSDSDQSPPRRRQRHDSSDLSPPRNTKDSDSDQSPPRRKRQSSSDLSPPRGRDSDLSPPRKRGSSASEHDTDKKAGLLSTQDLKRENALSRKREDEVFARMDSHKSGKDAKTVHRDKSGRKRNLEAEEQKKKEEERKKAIDDEKFKEWGRGVAQTEEARRKVEDYIHEVNKPLARYKDDKDLDAMLKEQEREDDPMLAYMQKKKTAVNKKAGVKEKPTYKGPAPAPNRFGIRPGYRWDGVDRSNGFENKRFAMISNKKATDRIAHKWSVEEM